LPLSGRVLVKGGLRASTAYASNRNVCSNRKEKSLLPIENRF